MVPIEDNGRTRIAIPIELTEHELARLQQWARGRKMVDRLVHRAKIILATAEGAENEDIAKHLGCTRRTVGTWRNRFADGRLEFLKKDAPRRGRWRARLE